MTIADLEVPQLEQHLRAGGFLTTFTDIRRKCHSLRYNISSV